MTQVQQAQELVESIQRKFATGSLFQWGIAHRDSERVIGTCTLAEIYRQNRPAEIGFALNLEFWGQGLAQEAVRAVLRYAFQELDLMRIEADIDPRNAGSIRTCEQLGFVREGYLRERWIVAGEVCDTVFYGLLRKEFT